MGNTPGDFKPGHKVNLKSQEEVEAIADALIKWAQEDDACHLAEFTVRYRKPKAWLYDLRKSHQCISESLDLAKEILASRYVRRGLFNEWNSSLVSKWSGIYDKELKSHDIEMAQAKGITKEELGEVVVNVVKYNNEK